VNDRSRSKTVRLVEIAELLSVTKQRAHQIAEERASPLRSARTLAAECGVGTRCKRGRSTGGARSPGASPGTPRGRRGRSALQEPADDAQDAIPDHAIQAHAH
jgi:hypothetical protein